MHSGVRSWLSIRPSIHTVSIPLPSLLPYIPSTLLNWPNLFLYHISLSLYSWIPPSLSYFSFRLTHHIYTSYTYRINTFTYIHTSYRHTDVHTRIYTLTPYPSCQRAPSAQMARPAKYQLTLSQLAEFDDLLTDALVDRVSTYIFFHPHLLRLRGGV